ncbi:MAG: glycerol-3-phosphate 1-O-acyltransferase PlsY [SAR202 cluster bacterium]|nr:glycerol-3-phosphate 1-O-acyltransferase PlsY [SAR202 cluster bacterium]
MTDFLVFAVVGYLLGSVPFGLIAGRIFGDIDVREHGSGMTGMTNVIRTVGIWAGMLVLSLDMGKTILAVVLTRLFTDSLGIDVVAAITAIMGHNWPLYSNFKGGRGTAPGWAGLIVLSPIAGIVASFVGLITIAVSRYVSLGSIVGATSGAITLIVLSLLDLHPLAYVWYGPIGATIIVVRHKENIQRLMSGKERKLGHRAEGL